MKLYGFTKVLGSPTICYGNKALSVKIIWAKRLKRIKCYKARLTSKEVWHHITNTDKWCFVGVITIKRDDHDFCFYK